VIESESQPGGGAAARLAGARPARSMAPSLSTVATPAAGPVAGLGPVSALGSSAAGGESGADRAVTAMYRTQYRGLVRLAVLLVGELGPAQDVVQDAFAAMHREWRRLRSLDAALPFLYRSVVAGSRASAPAPDLAVAPRYAAPAAAARGERTLQAIPSRAAETAAATVARVEPSGVIPALQRLPGPQREALALRLYLDLRDDQIAAAMQVTRAAARDHVAGGLAALRGVA
jgi:DNA-directed RNA polymerase specialized sigma24 family protein